MEAKVKSRRAKVVYLSQAKELIEDALGSDESKAIEIIESERLAIMDELKGINGLTAEEVEQLTIDKRALLDRKMKKLEQGFTI